MINSKVSVEKCDNYDETAIFNAVKNCIDAIGGIEKFVKMGTKVFIKVNMLMARTPEMVTTTHPQVLKAVAKLVSEAGGQIVVGDSGGGLYTQATLKKAYKTCGYEDVANEIGFLLNYDIGAKLISAPDGVICNEFNFINPYHDAEVYINLCKLKSHAMTVFSGAVKNNFGLIPGLEKPQMHYYYQSLDKFSTMLVDLAFLAKPTLSIMDAVIGMEGDGPSAGEPRKVGLILGSQNVFALDLVASDIVGFSADEIETVKQSIERGLCPATTDELEICGTDIEEVRLNDFKRPESKNVITFSQIPKFLRKPLEKIMAPKPKVVFADCVACGECMRSCPVAAIKIENKKAIIDYKNCIKCFCCHEMCSYKAIIIKKVKLF